MLGVGIGALLCVNTHESPTSFLAMDTCPPLCPCQPWPDEPGFSALEQDFLAAVADLDKGTARFMALMDDMATCVGTGRLAYLLSVPIKWKTSWVITAWARLDTVATADTCTAVLFAQKMVQYNACPRLAYQLADDDGQPGWALGSSQHPGRAVLRATRASPLRVAAVNHRPACFSVISEAMNRLTQHMQRWEKRGARGWWVFVLVCA